MERAINENNINRVTDLFILNTKLFDNNYGLLRMAFSRESWEVLKLIITLFSEVRSLPVCLK